LVFTAQEPTNASYLIWVVGAFVALVGVFVVYQKGQSGWTWREFGDGMLVLLVKGLVLGASTIAGHPHILDND
jgi:hypothetical protein